MIESKERLHGKGYICKDCTRLNYRERRERNIDSHKRKDSNYYQRNKEKILAKRREYNLLNKHKIYARQKVMSAVYSGRIVRPSNCSCCGKDCLPDAHHEDYYKPLDVIWLCRKCHQIKHNGK